jgi:hypothetical protein
MCAGVCVRLVVEVGHLSRVVGIASTNTPAMRATIGAKRLSTKRMSKMFFAIARSTGYR